MNNWQKNKALLLVSFAIFTWVDSISAQAPKWKNAKASAHSNDQLEVYEPVLSRVFTQLREKVGDDFMSYLHFSHVAALDFDSKSELSLTDLKRIDAYDFTFEIRVDDDENHAYPVHFRSDGTGIVKSNVDLPDIAAYPRKGLIKPFSRAVEVALVTKTLTENKKIYVNLIFDKTAGLFIWDVFAYRKGEGLQSNHVWVDANSLIVLRTFDQHEAF